VGVPAPDFEAERFSPSGQGTGEGSDWSRPADGPVRSDRRLVHLTAVSRPDAPTARRLWSSPSSDRCHASNGSGPFFVSRKWWRGPIRQIACGGESRRREYALLFARARLDIKKLHGTRATRLAQSD
jgi:hypothetical protein